jgi:hypothetical protein
MLSMLSFMPNRLLSGITFKLTLIISESVMQSLRPGARQPGVRRSINGSENQAT